MSDMMKFYDGLIRMGISHKTAQKAAEDLQHMIEEQIYPSDIWECMGTGAFKECYFIDSVVVKFATEDNHTKNTERAVYEKVLDETNLNEVFAHTIYIPLDETIPSGLLESNDESYIWDSEEKTYVENSDYTEPNFNYIVIQEKIDRILCNTSWNYINDKHPLLNKNREIIPISEINDILHIIGYQEWLQAFIDFYGMDLLNDFRFFCHSNHIYDLHTANVGFRKDGSPVIFDFLS